MAKRTRSDSPRDVVLGLVWSVERDKDGRWWSQHEGRWVFTKTENIGRRREALIFLRIMAGRSFEHLLPVAESAALETSA